ncbi:DUF2911 domain-containing protein [Foetidibacter luteolus]|uniref:DUF2911 domain-containing protein n=1 Tax=Foetidibacter luteolus TaxID=2608880 RepID=UPI00129ACAB4|nr:DUF2911 domain-containing protein [Foetidibacter luteolus]
MKKLFAIMAIASIAITSFQACAQDDKSKRPSPPAKATGTTAGGASVSIDYSQPSVKGRTIGKDLEPKKGEIWRAGANEATVFETSKDVKIQGQPLPAGKYALFTLINPDDTWTIIFNKTWKTWGAYDYEKNKGADALKVTVTPKKAASFAEKLNYTINSGLVSLHWGDYQVEFTVE